MTIQNKNPTRHMTGGPWHMISAVPVHREGERPTVYADRVGKWCIARKSDRHRKDHGLYLTPVAAADFMAGKIKVEGSKLRVLDPAAGVGILCCAVMEVLVRRKSKPIAIELVAYEVDESLITSLQSVLDYLVNWCRSGYGITVTVHVENTDFIMAHAKALRAFGGLFSASSRVENFDIVISNPPYFKVSKADPRAAAASTVVHGQPNIYALFMAVGAALLRQRGDFIFITPRSFASGPYFRQFRTVFFDMVRPAEVHIFGSRREAFSRDEVLQENVILTGTRQDGWHRTGTSAPLVISSSHGVRDLGDSNYRKIAMNTALNLVSVDKVLRLPIRDEDENVLVLVESWPSNLHSFGLNISTGPVVPFRARGLIGGNGDIPAKHVPLLWMNHVHAMQITWPLDRHKPEYIKRSGSEALLLPNRNYVFMRRFSAKEEAHRLTAAPYIAADFAIPEVGIENHLNYIHRPGGTLSEDEAWGLAALYNSRLLDIYFRTINGNTQVSATELRAMPLPTHQTVTTLGQHVKHLADPMESLNALVMSLITCPDLKEAAVGWC